MLKEKSKLNSVKVCIKKIDLMSHPDCAERPMHLKWSDINKAISNLIWNWMIILYSLHSHWILLIYHPNSWYNYDITD